MKFQLKKGTIEIASEKLIFSPKNTFIQRILAKKIILEINDIQKIIIRKQTNAVFITLENKLENLALLFDKKTGESNTFIDNLTKKNLSIKVIEKLSDSTNFCRESCCYYKNE